MTTQSRRPAPLPPRWFIGAAWVDHRAIYSITGEERIAILGYIEDGSNLVTKAMNGWADPEPAWWLNLLAHPDAMVDLADGSRLVRGRAATEDERPHLGASWVVYNKKQDAYAALRSRQTFSVCQPSRYRARHLGVEANGLLRDRRLYPGFRAGATVSQTGPMDPRCGVVRCAHT